MFFFTSLRLVNVSSISTVLSSPGRQVENLNGIVFFIKDLLRNTEGISSYNFPSPFLLK